MSEARVLRDGVAAGDGWGSEAMLEVLGQETADGWVRVAVRGGNRNEGRLKSGRLVYFMDWISWKGAISEAVDLPSPLSTGWLDFRGWTRVGK